VRRRQRRRQVRRRRLTAAAVLLALVIGGIVGAFVAAHIHRHASPQRASAPAPRRVTLEPRPYPAEVRGVHVTMELASIPGKLDEYIALKRKGLNAIELDVKDENVWRYDVGIAAAAAKAGFDEIQFDYVRFPSDGDLSQIRYPGAHPQSMGWTVPMFAKYATARLHPLGVRVSADVFGLSATRNLGIGQFPRRLSPYVDTIYPMV